MRKVTGEGGCLSPLAVALFEQMQRYDNLTPRYSENLPTLAVKVLSHNDTWAKVTRRITRITDQQRGLPMSRTIPTLSLGATHQTRRAEGVCLLGEAPGRCTLSQGANAPLSPMKRNEPACLTQGANALRSPGLLCVLVSLLFSGIGIPICRAADWPIWRGPDRNGISRETDWTDQWPASGPPVAWKASVGVGFSAVSVSKGRLFTLGHADGKDTVFALDALTGKELWKHSYEADLGDMYFDGGPTATPTIDGDRVYSLSRWGDLFCFDAATGRIVWSKNVAKDPESRIPTWGFSSSPVVHESLLLLNVGRAGLALDKATGKVRWSSADDEAGYSTPFPCKRGGIWQLLVSSDRGYAAVELATGKPVWEVRWPTRYGVNAADPIIDGDRVLLSSGYGKGAALYKLGAGEPTVVWQNKDLKNQFSSSVLIDGFLYGVDGDTTEKAELKCLDFATGRVRWTREGIGSGALMAAAGRLIVLSDQGELLVGKASPEGFTPTARAAVIAGKCWTAPVLANGRLYCRSATGDLVCLDLRKERP